MEPGQAESLIQGAVDDIKDLLKATSIYPCELFGIQHPTNPEMLWIAVTQVPDGQPQIFWGETPTKALHALTEAI